MDSPTSSSGRRYSGQSLEGIFDERYKSAVAAYQSYMEGLQLFLSENELKMQKILSRRSVPLWFQELSNEQVQVADALLEAIRDDLDEGTHFRCRSLIRRLGVYPLCPAWVFKEAVQMSGGSDISFLWFLLGLHYSKKEEQNSSTDYSINERLIMSSICHLDMMTTLRGLEAVLPPRAEKKSPPERSLSSSSHDWHWNVDHCSPYLEPLRVPDPRPKNWTGVRDFHPEAPFSLSRYAAYQDPHFIIPNEATRWFARRTSGNQTTSFDEAVQTDQGEDRRCSKACDSAEQIVKELLNDQLGLMVRKENERAELCRKHRDMEKRRQKLLGLVTKRSEKRCSNETKVLLTHQERPVPIPGCSRSGQTLCSYEHFRQLFRERIEGCAFEGMCTPRNVPSKDELAKIDSAVETTQTQADLATQKSREAHMIKLLLRKLIDDSIASCLLTPRSNCPECWHAYEHQRKLQARAKCSCPGDPQPFCFRNMLDRSKGALQKFFRCCRGRDVPYEFDYRKILEDDTTQPIQCPMKRAIRVALEMEPEDADEGVAIDRCMKNMWHCELKLWNEQFLKGMEEAKEKETKIDFLDFPYIDSKDPVFLQQLLKRALLKLSESPKYVLATFPEAHKLPFLNAWIRHRYGVRISAKRKQEMLYESKHFWEWLIPRVTEMRWPICADLGLEGRVNWNYKRRLDETAQKHLARFYRKFKRIQIQEGRLYWSTMDAYGTNVDRFRQVFFDYLPNCEPLVGPMVRPWQTFEHRNGPLPTSDSKTRC